MDDHPWMIIHGVDVPTLFFNHLIDAAKQKAASIECKVRIDQGCFNHLIDAAKQKAASIKCEVRIDQGCFNHLIDAAKQKAASIKCEVRIDQGCTYVRSTNVR